MMDVALGFLSYAPEVHCSYLFKISIAGLHNRSRSPYYYPNLQGVYMLTTQLGRFQVTQRLAVLSLLIAVAFSSASSISAGAVSQGDPRANNPHAIVSSDGSIPAASTAGIVPDSEGSYSASFPGTNKTPKGSKRWTAHRYSRHQASRPVSPA